MPSFNTTIYGNQIGSGGVSPGFGIPDARKVGGKLRYAIIPYTVAGTEATGDTINIVRLKKGATVIPGLCRVLSEAAFDVDDMNIGDGVNANRFADAIDTTNAALSQDFGLAGDEAYAPTPLAAGEEVVTATLVNVVTTTAGQKVLWVIAYMDE